MGSNSSSGQLKQMELSSFFENLAMMIRAGISTEEAVGLLCEETTEESPALSAALVKIRDGLSAGSSLSEAMRSGGAFPDYATDMTAASEYAGKLEDTLFHLSDYYRSEHKFRGILITAVRYPVILMCMVLAVLVIMLTLVFPAFSGVYSNLAGGLTESSFSYLGFSFIVCRVLLVALLIVLIIFLTGIAKWQNGKKAQVKKALGRFRGFRQLFANMDLYRFTACFEMFIAGGEMQDDALKKSMVVVEGEELKTKLEACARKMEEGLSFSQTCFEEKLYDGVNNRMLIPAERSGMLDDVLKKILGNLKDNTKRMIGRISNSAEPILTGFLMIFVGLMLISLMIPLIGIMNSMG